MDCRDGVETIGAPFPGSLGFIESAFKDLAKDAMIERLCH